MAKIIFGYTSFALGSLGLLISAIIMTLLFILPPATYLFKAMLKFSVIPIIISITGLFFYALQWRIFTVKIVNAALVMNLANLLADAYLIYGLNSSI
jgi:hypothetical protein